ncbi:MAG: ABC transporter permease [Acidobacteria bacterium]|nr:MAG: ABC transporter permease [Acidobacteriota bacterium]
MKARRLVMVAIQSIVKNLMRTLLTMLGVIIGVGSVTVMVAIGQGAQDQIRKQVEGLGTNMIVITPGSSSQGGVSRGAASFNRLTTEDSDALQRGGFLLSAVSPVIMAPAQVVGGNGNWRTIVQGVDTYYQLIRDWEVSSGTFFDVSDVRSKKKVAVIGATVASQLFPGSDPVGQRIQLRNVPFEIVGVLAEKGQTAEGNDQDDTVLAPYTTVQTRLAGRMFIAQILASTSSPDDMPAAQKEVAEILRETHALADWEDDDFTVRNQTDLAETAEGTTQVMTFLLAAIASISLLVGGIGIMNIMLVSVTERTREIGLRMAVGARGSDVLVQFMIEAVVMSVLGGVIGVAGGAAAALALARVTGWGVAISPETVVLALVFAAAVGVFFGFYPARRAAALHPIEALRFE